MKWSSSAAGTASAQVRTVTGYSLDSSSGVSLFTSQQSANEGPYNAFGRAIVLHDSSGVRVSCGCCAGSGDEITGLTEVSMGRCACCSCVGHSTCCVLCSFSRKANIVSLITGVGILLSRLGTRGTLVTWTCPGLWLLKILEARCN